MCLLRCRAIIGGNESRLPNTPALLARRAPAAGRLAKLALQREPVQSGLVLAGLLAAGLGVRGVSGHAHLALLAVSALALSLWRFFLPVVFTLSADGVNESVLGRDRRIPWSAVRRYEIHPKGVLLSHRQDATWVDSFQGIFLPWGNHRQEILALLNYYVRS